MSVKLYLRNRFFYLLINLLAMLTLSLFLRINGNGWDVILFILVVWMLVLLLGIAFSAWKKKRYLEGLLARTEQLQERYLIAEVMEKSELAEDQAYCRILKLAEKSMLEEIGQVQWERKEYKEYIEQWVHEMKTPLAAMKLICENNRNEQTQKLLPLLETADRYAEQALYYARSEHAQKDYLIRELNPFESVHQAVADNKYLLLLNQVQVAVEEENCVVYSDEKWLVFLLNQLIANAVKYKTEEPKLRFYVEREENCVKLCVADNGVGISESDLPRVFEKGFTGQNGRKKGATGIGLYLCRRLCDKLGIGITVWSDKTGTVVRLIFTNNDFIRVVK